MEERGTFVMRRTVYLCTGDLVLDITDLARCKGWLGGMSPGLCRAPLKLALPQGAFRPRPKPRPPPPEVPQGFRGAGQKRKPGKKK